MDLTSALLCVISCVGGALIPTWAWRHSERSWKQRLARARAEQGESAALLEAERHKSHQAQAEQRALFESMAEGVLLLDRTNRITMANKSFRELLRLTGEVRGKTILEAVRLPQLAEMAARLADREIIRHADLELPGAPSRCLAVSASVVADPQGGYQGAILVFHDLTRVRQLEDTRREFVANVSHELRTPLSLIKGFVETLLDGAKDDPVQNDRFLQTIQKHTNRLTYLIEDLLTLSKLESGPVSLNRQPITLMELTQRVVDDLRGKALARRITIKNLLDPVLEVAADADRLQQVIFNLVENAIKYGREGGYVLIQSEPHGSSEVKVLIQDDGPGIPIEAQARVFERFYRVDRARSRDTGGTGLGLAIVKHIVQAHGGTVGLTSELGRGTIFSFTVPAAGERQARSPVEAATALAKV
jgi:two-component system phosphate regulon sensor histidine kinase PhoR